VLISPLSLWCRDASVFGRDRSSRSVAHSGERRGRDWMLVAQEGQLSPRWLVWNDSRMTVLSRHRSDSAPVWSLPVFKGRENGSAQPETTTMRAMHCGVSAALGWLWHGPGASGQGGVEDQHGVSSGEPPCGGIVGAEVSVHDPTVCGGVLYLDPLIARGGERAGAPGTPVSGRTPVPGRIPSTVSGARDWREVGEPGGPAGAASRAAWDGPITMMCCKSQHVLMWGYLACSGGLARCFQPLGQTRGWPGSVHTYPTSP
jgi:hypothetical protein